MLLICLFVACLIAFAFGAYFWIKYNGTFAKKLAIWALLASLLTGCTVGAVKTHCETNATNLIETYKELAMFNQTVANSSNEYIRNHYYNEVQEYNENYAESLKKSSSIWFNVLYPKNTFKQISTIKFELRGDDVIELHQNNQ